MYSAALALSAGSYCTGSLPWTTPCPAGTYQVVRHACMPACYVLLLTLLLALLFRLITYPFLTRSCTPSNIFLHSTLLPPPLTPTTPSQPFSGASSVSACLPCPAGYVCASVSMTAATTTCSKVPLNTPTHSTTHPLTRSHPLRLGGLQDTL